MKLEPFALIVGLVSFSTATWGADCSIVPYTFGTKGIMFDTSTTMTVKSGKPCGSTLQLAVVQAVHDQSLKRISITGPAKNGVAFTRSLDYWGYKSNNGFTGSDSFIVTIMKKDSTSNIHVTVNVVP